MPPASLSDEELQEQERRRARGDEVDDDPSTPEELLAIAHEDDEGAPEKPPKWVADRLREAGEKAREEREGRIRAEAERDSLRAQPAKDKPAPVDVQKLRDQALDKLLEGDKGGYLQLENQARAEERRLDIEAATATALAKAAETQLERDLRRAANAVAEQYPFLDSNSPEADKVAIKEVVGWRDVYINMGYAADDALRKAAEKVAAANAKAGGEGSGDDELARRRAAAALSRSGAAALRQPPPVAGGKGDRARTGATAEIDVAKLSDKEFRDLPSAEKARLRGDSV